MALTLAQLVTAPSKETLKAQLLQALQGIGFVYHATGAGPGTVTVVQGTPNGSYAVVVLIASSGEPGIATYQVSTDGGRTYSAAAVIPSSPGTLVGVGTTGVSISFQQGAAGTFDVGDPSFDAGDQYIFALFSPSLPTSQWAVGSVPLALVDADSDTNGSFVQVIQKLALASFPATAKGSWLDILANFFYNLFRTPSVSCSGLLNLADPNGLGPWTFATGTVIAGTIGGLQYTLAAPVTVPQNGSANAVFTASAPGAKYNVGNSSIVQVFKGVPGLVITNPAQTNGTWITSPGADAQSDAALALACINQWPQLAETPENVPTAVYATWAMDADTSITRVLTRPSANVPGQVNVFCAGANGPVGATPLANVQAVLNQRLGISATGVAYSAANKVITLTGTVNVLNAYLAITPANVQAALVALEATIALNGLVAFSVLQATIQNVGGVSEVINLMPATDTQLADVTVGGVLTPQVATFDYSGLVFVGV